LQHEQKAGAIVAEQELKIKIENQKLQIGKEAAERLRAAFNSKFLICNFQS